MKTKYLFFVIVMFALLSVSSNISYTQWTQVNSTSGPYYIDTANNKLWITNSNGLSYSTNSGLDWISTFTGGFFGMDIFNSNIILKNGVSGVYISSNGGVNWTSSLNDKSIAFVACDSSYMIASCFGSDSGIYRTSNYGENWVFLGGMKRLQTLFLSERNLYIGRGFFPYGPVGSFYKSTNYGNTFLGSLWMCTVYSIWAQGPTVYASVDNSYNLNGLNKSINGGSIFFLTSLTDSKIKSILCIGDTVVACSSTTGVHVSSNGGNNWIIKNEGLTAIPNSPIMVLHNGYLFLLNSGGILWKRSISDLMTTVNKLGNSVPDKYVLEQNYPNPFNPMTRIQFQVPSSKFVKLIVFDILGKEVATLVNESLQPGTYETTFNAGNLTSGVYFYRLQTNGYTESKRMILVK